MPDQPWNALTTLGMSTHSSMSEQVAIHCPSGEVVAIVMGKGIRVFQYTAPTALKNLLGNSTAVVCWSPRSWSFMETDMVHTSMLCMGSESKASWGRSKTTRHFNGCTADELELRQPPSGWG